MSRRAKNSCRAGLFWTPPPTWENPPAYVPRSENNARKSLYHAHYKVPSGDSPYGIAKKVQLVDKNPSKAISLFWAAINSGDRVDSALKDMAFVMRQLDRSDEAIEAIKSFRHLCPEESQESLDNVLIDLYRRCGKVHEEIQMLRIKLKHIEEGTGFKGKRTKVGRSQGRKVHITIEKEYSRVAGKLAWAYLQKKDYKSAEEHYRKALSLENDKNMQCNLAICLMHLKKIAEAKLLLQSVHTPCENGQIGESFSRSFDRATQLLRELESVGSLKIVTEKNEELEKTPTLFTQPKRCMQVANKCGHGRWSYAEASNHGCSRKLLFQQEKNCENVHQSEPASGLTSEERIMNTLGDPASVISSDILEVDEPRKDAKGEFSHGSMTSIGDCNNTGKAEDGENRKTWADMVEEDDQESENLLAHHEQGFLSTESILSPQITRVQKLEPLVLEDGYYTQPLHAGRKYKSLLHTSMAERHP